MSSNLFTIIDNSNSPDSLDSKNFIYMFNKFCEKEFNKNSSNMLQQDEDKIQLKFNDPDVSEDKQKEIDFRYLNLKNLKQNNAKRKIMEKCSEYRFRRASPEKWALEKSSIGSTNWVLVKRAYPHIEQILNNINRDIREPTLVKDDNDDFVLIATSKKIQPENSPTGGKKKKKVRKHRGIIQTGGGKGKLKKGYRFSGKKLKNGLPEIVKAKKL